MAMTLQQRSATTPGHRRQRGEEELRRPDRDSQAQHTQRHQRAGPDQLVQSGAVRLLHRCADDLGGGG